MSEISPPPYSRLNAVFTCLGVAMALLLFFAVAGFTLVSCSLVRERNRWSVALDNESGATCTVYLAMGRDEQPPLEFRDIVSKVDYHRRPLVEGTGSTYIRTVRIVWPDGEKTVTVNQEIPRGCKFSIYLADEHYVGTSFDYDYHM